MELRVEARPESGKGVARKLRRAGKVPAVFYGSRHQPVALTISPDELVAALSTPKLRNTIIRMVSDDSELNGRTVMVKEIQRHPISRQFLHVDLLEVYSDVTVKAEVPIHVTGHARGVDLGGTMDLHMRYVNIKCPPEKIPAFLTVDVAELDIGDSIKLGEISIGEGIELLDEENVSVVSIAAPRVAEAAAGEAGEEAEAAEGEAAPAEGEDKKDKKEDKEKEEKQE